MSRDLPRQYAAMRSTGSAGAAARALFVADILRLHGKGRTSRQIAEVLGVSPKTVTTRLRELGLASHREELDP